MSLCVFLAPVFLTGDGRFSWDTGGLIIIWGSSSLASVDSLSQTFSVTVRKKKIENLKIQRRRRPRERQKRNRFRLAKKNDFARASRFFVQYDVKVPNFTKNWTPEEFAYTWKSKLGPVYMVVADPR